MPKPSDAYVELLKAAARERDDAAALRADATSRLARAAYEARIDGVPIRDIATAAGLTKQGLYDVARSHGYELRRAGSKPAPSTPKASRQSDGDRNR
jgi:hypothetical protein